MHIFKLPGKSSMLPCVNWQWPKLLIGSETDPAMYQSMIKLPKSSNLI